MSTPFHETALFKKGRRGEQLVQDILINDGCYIVPSYDYCRDDKAPRMQGKFKNYVIPDLDVSAHGNRLWVEVKVKSSSTLYRKWNREEHGIPLRHYRDYQEVSKISGCRVILFIVEESSGQVFYADLTDLEKNSRIYDGNRMSRGGMIFFDKKDFVFLLESPEIKSNTPGLSLAA